MLKFWSLETIFYLGKDPTIAKKGRCSNGDTRRRGKSSMKVMQKLNKAKAAAAARKKDEKCEQWWLYGDCKGATFDSYDECVAHEAKCTKMQEDNVDEKDEKKTRWQNNSRQRGRGLMQSFVHKAMLARQISGFIFTNLSTSRGTVTLLHGMDTFHTTPTQLPNTNGNWS